MSIFLIIGVPAGLYLAIAWAVYKWMMGRNPNTMQKSLSGFVLVFALLWPLGPLTWFFDWWQGRK